MPLSTYPLRLGPLTFVAPVGEFTETLADALEAVGATLAPGERRPRPFKMSIAVRADRRDARVIAAGGDLLTYGRRLRNQVRELVENPRYRRLLFFAWEGDPDLDCWLAIGGADLAEDEVGVGAIAGEWTLSLTDCYIVGRPSTHRAGRRVEVADRRTGLVARDSRGLIYSTDHAGIALPTKPLVIPGEVNFVRRQDGRASTLTSGPTFDGDRLWREVTSNAGEAHTFAPISPRNPATVEDAGAVKVWDLSTRPGALAAYTAAGDTDPAGVYGWTRVLGPTRAAADRQFAIENGQVRLVWISSASTTGGLALEWRQASGVYYREGRLHAAAGSLSLHEFAILELSSERVVVLIRGASSRSYVVTLQRGWHGPRIEAYDDSSAGTARIEFVPEDAGATVAAGAQAHVDVITLLAGAPPGARTMRAVRATNDTARASFASGAGELFTTGAGFAWTRTRAVALQFALPSDTQGDTALAGLALADVRATRILTARGL